MTPARSATSAQRRMRGRKSDESNSPNTGKVTTVWIGQGADKLPDLKQEIDGYWEMLNGRRPLPVRNGVASLMESATGMYVRASEIASRIHRGEQEGTITRNSSWYRFRTGELRDFLDACSKAVELGSRLVTVAKLEAEMKEFD